MYWEKEENKFIEKVINHYKITKAEVEEALKVEYFGRKSATFKDGKILTFTTFVFEDSIRGNLGLSKSEYYVDYSDLCHLEELVYFNNHKNTNNNLVSFSTLSKLKTLEVRNTTYEELDIRGCTKLESLYCRGSNFYRVDLSQNIHLKTVYLSYNSIEQIDLSNNQELKVADIFCFTLQRIIIPKDNKITDLSLDGVYTEVKLDYCTKLTGLSLRCGNSAPPNFKKNPYLKELHLYSADFEKLDISSLQNLRTFKVDDSTIKNLICNEMQAISIPQLQTISKLEPTKEQQEYIDRVKLHHKALEHNWDEGTAKLSKILNNSLCDKATALAIYWMGRPGYYLKYSKISEVPEYDKKLYRFIKKIEKAYLNNEFNENIISFDPGYSGGVNWLAEAIPDENEKNKIPDAMKKPLNVGKPNAFNFKKKMTLPIE